MGEATNKAVFLSYASQDADAARRISESLRSAGVEVWFDADGGLEHGDDWDAKIRRQIKECVLFIPIISANTQARHEGYFRLEWELAAERAMTIASGVAFILPVVIDGTREPDALVPDRFRKVQWTRLPGGEVRPDVRARLLKLWSHRTATLSPAGPTTAKPAGPSPDPGTESRLFFRPALVGVIVALLVIASAIGWSLWPPKTAGHAGKATTPVNVSDVDRLMAQALAFFDHLNYTRADIAAADVLARKATDLAPDSAEAWATRAYVQAAAVWRVGDRSDTRLQDMETFATRALAIDPKQVRAMIALGELYRTQQAWAQAEAIARRGIELQPDSPHLYRILTGALEMQGHHAEAMALRQECVRKFPRDAFTHHGLGVQLMLAGDFAGALHSFDQALAIENFATALLDKARLLVAWKGDLTGARAVMEQIPPRDRTEIRVIAVAMWLGLLERRLDQVQTASGLTAETYVTNATLAAQGPKASSLALAYHLSGKPALAQQQWQTAEAVARARQREYPSDDRAPIHLAIALAWLGRTEEAAREVAASEAAIREQAGGRERIWNAVLVARYYAARGEAAPAVSLLRLANASIETSAQVLSLEPWWDKIRAAPEFAALMTEMKASAAEKLGAASAVTSTPAAKSVAVLAFENLTAEKDNEYFSEGISEELLNQLAKVPDLRVAARTSAFYFKGRNATAQEIGRTLGMAHVVDGSVRRIGNSVRVIAYLSRTDTGEQVWTEKFEGDLDKPWALQERIAGRIAEALQVKLGGASQAGRSINPEAYRLMLEGRYYWNQRSSRTDEVLTRAVQAYQRSLEIDPTFAEAHAGLGDVWVTRGQYRSMDGRGSSAPADYSQAKAEARRALELDARLAEPNVTLAYVAYCERDFAESERHFARAFALNPNYALAHHWHALLLSAQGREDRAVEEITRSLQLDPLSANSLWSSTMLHLYAGSLTEALADSERSLELRPGVLPVISDRAFVLLKLGRKEEAIEAARQVAAHPADELRWWADGHAIYVLRECGELAEAARHAAAALARFSAGDYRRAFVLAAIGRGEEALQALDNVPTLALGRMYGHPMWDPWRQDPRFTQIMARHGCEKEYELARQTLARMAGQTRPSR